MSRNLQSSIPGGQFCGVIYDIFFRSSIRFCLLKLTKSPLRCETCVRFVFKFSSFSHGSKFQILIKSYVWNWEAYTMFLIPNVTSHQIWFWNFALGVALNTFLGVNNGITRGEVKRRLAWHTLTQSDKFEVFWRRWVLDEWLPGECRAACLSEIRWVYILGDHIVNC